MRRSTSCTCQMRTWRRGRSPYLGKARARHPSATARPTPCTTERGKPSHTPSCATYFPGSQPGVPPSHRPPMGLAAGPIHTCPPPCPGTRAATTGGRPSGKSAWSPPCSSSSSRVLRATPAQYYGAPPVPRPPILAPEARDAYTPCCGHRRSPPTAGLAWCGLRALSRAPDMGLWRDAWAERFTSLPPQCGWTATGG